jgi:hypothetical protein
VLNPDLNPGLNSDFNLLALVSSTLIKARKPPKIGILAKHRLFWELSWKPLRGKSLYKKFRDSVPPFFEYVNVYAGRNPDSQRGSDTSWCTIFFGSGTLKSICNAYFSLFFAFWSVKFSEKYEVL